MSRTFGPQQDGVELLGGLLQGVAIRRDVQAEAAFTQSLCQHRWLHLRQLHRFTHTCHKELEAKPSMCSTHMAGEMSNLFFLSSPRAVKSFKDCWNTSTTGRPARSDTQHDDGWQVGLVFIPLHSCTQQHAVLGAVGSRVRTVNVALEHEVDHVVQLSAHTLGVVPFPEPGVEGWKHLRLAFDVDGRLQRIGAKQRSSCISPGIETSNIRDRSNWLYTQPECDEQKESCSQNPHADVEAVVPRVALVRFSSFRGELEPRAAFVLGDHNATDYNQNVHT